MKLTRLPMLAAPLLALGMLAASAPDAPPASNDDAPPPPPERMEADQPAPPHGRVGLELRLDPKALRIRLQRMISRGQEMAQRGQAALDKLDAGASASEVLNELRIDEPSRRSRAEGEPGDDPRRAAKPDYNEPHAISPHDRDRVLAFIQREFPELWATLGPIVEQDPHKADMLVGRMAPQIMEILALETTLPELAEIKTRQMRIGFEFVEAGRIYRIVVSDPNASESQRAEAMERLRVLAGMRFDADLEAKRFEIDRLEARLEKLRQSLAKLEERRDAEIEQMAYIAKRNADRLSRQQSQRRKQRDNDSDDDSADD